MKTTHTVLAVGAHPDDIEFMMAGTLLLLRDAGAEIHMWNLADGRMGTVSQEPEDIIRIRREEALNAARVAGATLHPPLFQDLAIFYDAPSLAQVAAVVRDIRPTVVLTQSPQDYMEDHQNTCRLVVGGVFARNMRNFVTVPARTPCDEPVALYHALPHGLQDQLRQRVVPHGVVDIGSVLDRKREMLAQHRSQKEWLDVSQGMDAYLTAMVDLSREVGRTSGRCDYAEGWRRHSHPGFGPVDYDPLKTLLEKNYAEMPEQAGA